MMLEFKYIKDKGDLDSERSVFKVISDCNLGDFIAFRTKETSEDGISSKIELPFWFPDKRIKKGDTVVLYSKKRRVNEKTNKDGSISHFFYWGNDTPLFLEDDDSVLLVEIRRLLAGN